MSSRSRTSRGYREPERFIAGDKPQYRIHVSPSYFGASGARMSLTHGTLILIDVAYVAPQLIDVMLGKLHSFCYPEEPIVFRALV